MKMKKRLFGPMEAIFDLLYLLAAFAIGIYLLTAGESAPRQLAGSMALLLAAGDAFHLIPRMGAILTRREGRWIVAMGFGKFITSITITVYYLLLWQIGLLLFGDSAWTLPVYLLAALRILLCLFPQNRWLDPRPPVRWALYRNLPFVLLGGMVAALFAVHAGQAPAVTWMWLAILLSFGCYLPVVLLAGRKPMLGMLMLPKTCAYLWMLVMCL